MATQSTRDQFPLAHFRETRSLSQAELARRVEVDVEVIRRLERGHAAGPVLVSKLAKALDVPGHLLLPRVKPPNRKMLTRHRP